MLGFAAAERQRPRARAARRTRSLTLGRRADTIDRLRVVPILPEESHVSESGAAAAARESSHAFAAGLLAWVFPGLGHLYLRRFGKALVLMGAILALFVLGVVMDSRLAVNAGLEDPLALLFSLAQMGIGAPYVAARYLGFGGPENAVELVRLVKSPSYEYGNTFTAVAGLLNILVVLDALDTARGYKDVRPASGGEPRR
jgi:hypothetical protein